jgi:hypothetical protein
MACEDISQIWAFRGSREEIDAIVGALLTPHWQPRPEERPAQ